MSDSVPFTVVNVRKLIRDAEAKADESLMAKLELMKQILRVRQTEEMPAPHVGQDGIIRLARAIQSAVDAQNNLFRTHDALTKASHEVYADLPHDDTPPSAGEVAAAA